MNVNSVRPDVRVRTNKILGSTEGIFVEKRHLDARRPDKEGVLKGYVEGHGGDVWWVIHDDHTIAAYKLDEFEAIE